MTERQKLKPFSIWQGIPSRHEKVEYTRKQTNKPKKKNAKKKPQQQNKPKKPQNLLYYIPTNLKAGGSEYTCSDVFHPQSWTGQLCTAVGPYCRYSAIT